MNVLTHPLALRMELLFLCALGAFTLGMLTIKLLRRNLTGETESMQASPVAQSESGTPVEAYNAVIQELKQQKHELTAQQLAERRKAKASDTLSTTVLANLSCGVVLLTTAGLVRQANAAARKMLGFASPAGLDLAELFRTATLRSTTASAATAADLQEVLAPAVAGTGAVRGVLLNYVTRDGETRVLELNASPVMADDATLMGTALVLDDKTDLERIRHDQRTRQEVSSEMAQELRNSLATISGYAQQLAHSRDSELARQLANGIAREAAQLDRTIGSFLGGAQAATAGS